MVFLDTGPPRHFSQDALNKVIEEGLRTYDFEDTFYFDPDSVCFLFRFAGEPTRTPYYLGTRMFDDDEYGQLLKLVQSYWHFHTYSQGIRKMEQICRKDPIPANCFELAGLYRSTRQIDKALAWRKKGIENLPAGDNLSRLSSAMSLSALHDLGGNRGEAIQRLETVTAELRKMEIDPARSSRYLAMRFSVAQSLAYYGRPLAGWRAVRSDATRLAERQKLGDANTFVLTRLYRKLKDRQRAQEGDLSTEALQAVEVIERLLVRHFRTRHFQADDDFVSTLSKYATLADFYAGRSGEETLLAALRSNGPYPDGERDHSRRSGDRATEQEDWKWIRLSLPAYRLEIARSIDSRAPPGALRPERAVKLIGAALRAAKSAARFGSLGALNYKLLSFRVIRAAIQADDDKLAAVLKEVRRRNWGPLYKQIAATFGESARFLEPDAFRRQMLLFRQYVPTKPQYFQVAYKAFQAQAYDAALTAAEIAAEKFLADPVLQREKAFIMQRVAEMRKSGARKPKSKFQSLPGKKAGK